MNSNNTLFWKWSKRILKFLAWSAGILILLLVLIIFLIRIESVQNYIVKKVTKSISDKTHSTVSIGHIYISFPKEITIENNNRNTPVILAIDCIKNFLTRKNVFQI